MVVRLCAIGHNLVNRYVDQELMYPGGHAVNVAVHARRSGATGAFLGVLGLDNAGDLIESSLLLEGVRIDRVRRVQGETAFATIFTDDQGARSLGPSSRGVSLFSLDEADLAYLAEFDVVHLCESNGMEQALAAIGARVVVSYDFAERDNDYAEQILPWVTFAFFSRPQSSAAEAGALVTWAHSKGAPWVIVTRGTFGTVISNGEQVHHQPAAPAQVVDTLGARDSFIARLVVRLWEGGGLLDAAEQAALYSAEVSSVPGGYGYGRALVSPTSGETLAKLNEGKTMTLAFPTIDDYRARLGRLQSAIRERGLDAFALSSFDNHRFLGGVDGIATVRPIWVIVPANGEPRFVSPRIEASELKQQSWIPVAEEWIEWEEEGVARSAIEALVRQLEPLGPSARIGIDYDATSAASLEALRSELGAERISDATPTVREVRKVKDLATIDVVRRSADIAVKQFQASVAAAGPGVPEWEVVRASRDAGIERAAFWWGGDVEHSPLIQGIHVLGSGPDRANRPHAVGAGREMQDGDVLQVCYCGRPFFGHGICFDRPVRVGEKEFTPEVLRIVNAARAAQEAAIDRIKPGVTTGEIHQAAIDAIEAAGIASALRHRTGRGIGLSDPEWPEIKAGDPTVLEPGMIIAIEPGVYVDGVAGARFGDTLLVTDDGFEALTPLDLGRAL